MFDPARPSSALVFSSASHAHLLDHVIHGRPVVSAASLVLELSKLANHNQVGGIQFRLLVPLDEPIQVIICGEDIQLSGSAGLFVVAKVEKGYTLNNATQMRVDDNGSIVSRSMFYRKMSEVGYTFNGMFKSVDEVRLRRNGDWTEGQVQLTSEVTLDVALDGVWQAMVFCILQSDEVSAQSTSILVPAMIEQLKICDSPSRTDDFVGHFNIDWRRRVGNFRLENWNEHVLLISGTGICFTKLESQDDVRLPEGGDDNTPGPRIGIMSFGCRLPGGVTSLEEFWALISSGEVTSQRIPTSRIPTRNDLIKGVKYGRSVEGGSFLEQDPALFDHKLFDISAVEAQAMDPQQRLLMQVVFEALERGGVTDCRHLAFYVGVMGSEYALLPSANALGMLGSSLSFLSGRLSHFFDARGESLVVDTACSSSLVALHTACESIRRGRARRAVVAGVNLILTEQGMGQRANGGMLSADGRCHSFDAAASGYGRSEGAVAVLLEKAEADQCYAAFVEATSSNHDGRSVGITAPNGAAHQRLVGEVMNKVAGSGNGTPKLVQAWECHGTGTSLGDPIEVNALRQAVEESRSPTAAFAPLLHISSAKQWIGHTEAASGLVGLMKAVLQLKHCSIVALPQLHSINPNIQLGSRLNLAVQSTRLSSDALCGVSSFGVSGTNACVLVSRCNRPLPKVLPSAALDVIPISAKTAVSLKSMHKRISQFLDQSPDPNQNRAQIAAIGFAIHRKHFNHKSAILMKGGKVEIMTRSAIKLDDCWIQIKSGSSDFEAIQFCTTDFDDDNQTTESVRREQRLKAFATLLFNFGVNLKPIGPIKTNGEQMSEHQNKPKQIFSRPCYPVIGTQNREFHITSLNALSEFVAHAYLSLPTVNWHAFYPNKLPLAYTNLLPTYCFDEKRFWKVELKESFDDCIVGSLITSSKQGDAQVFENFICQWRHDRIMDAEVDLPLLVEVCKRCLKDASKFKVVEWRMSTPFVIGSDVWMVTKVTDRTDRKLSIHLQIDNVDVMDANLEIVELGNVQQETEKKVGVWSNRDCKLAMDNIIFLRNLIKSLQLNMGTVTVVNSPGKRLTKTIVTGSKVIVLDETGTELVEADMPRTTTNSSNSKMPEPKSKHDKHKKHKHCPGVSHLVSRKSESSLKADIVSCLEKAISESIDADRDGNVGFFDLGLDSLGMVGFVNELNLFHLKVTSNDLMVHSTINALAAFLGKPPKKTHTDPHRPINGSTPVSEESPIQTNNEVVLKENNVQHESGSGHIQSVTTPIAQIVAIGRTDQAHQGSLLQVHLKQNVITCTLQTNGSAIHNFNLKSLSTKLNDLKPNHLVTSFASSIEYDSSKVTKCLQQLGQALTKLEYRLELSCVDSVGYLGHMGRAFLKCLAAEMPDRLAYAYDEHLTGLDEDLVRDATDISRGMWLVFGGASGIGQAMAHHLASHYHVPKVITVSRRSVLGQPPHITHFKANVLSTSDLTRLMKFVNSLETPVQGIVFSVGFTEDAFFSTIRPDSFKRVLHAKCTGLANVLDLFQRSLPEYVVLNSSISALFGNAGQTSYSAANAYLDHVAARLNQKEVRRAVSINWGNWLETGLAANPRTTRLLQEKGLHGLRTREALRCFDHLLARGECAQAVIAKVDWDRLCERKPECADMCRELLANKTEPERSQIKTRNVEGIQDVIKEQVARMLKLEVGEVKDNVGFIELGLDSLGMLTLTNELNRHLQAPILGVINLFEHFTVTKLTEFIRSKQMPELVRAEMAELTGKRTESLSSPDKSPRNSSSEVERKGQLVFLFPGSGSVRPSTDFSVLFEVPFIARQLRICSEYFEDLINLSIYNLLKENLLNEFDLTTEHSILFSVSFSIAKFWMHVGLRPDVLIGHSAGEMTALCLAGCLDLDMAVKLVVERSRSMSRARGCGKMLAVDPRLMEETSLKALKLSLATSNHEHQIVLSGSGKAVDRAVKLANEKAIVCKVVNNNYPFHSTLIRDDYFKNIDGLDWSAVKSPGIVVISNLTARPLNRVDANYIKSHARYTVLFSNSVDLVLKDNECTFVEMGLSQVLSTIVQKKLQHLNLPYLSLGFVTPRKSQFEVIVSKLQLKGHYVDNNRFNSELLGHPAGPRGTSAIEKKQGDNSSTMHVPVDNSDFKVVADHVLFGEPIVPAAFLFNSLMKHLKSNQMKVVDLKLLTKIKMQDLDKLIIVEENNQYEWRHVQDLGTLFAACQCAPFGMQEEPSWSIDEPGNKLSVSGFYSLLHEAGFNYGDSLRLLTDIRLFGEDHIRTKAKNCAPPWIAIDLALQSLTVGLLDPKRPCCCIPVKIREVNVNLKENMDGEWAFYGEITRRDPQLVEGRIRCYYEGELCMLIEDVLAVKLFKSELFNKRPRRNALSTDGDLDQVYKSGRKSNGMRKGFGLDEESKQRLKSKVLASVARRQKMAQKPGKKDQISNVVKDVGPAIFISAYYAEFASQYQEPVFEDFAQTSLTEDVLRLRRDVTRFNPVEFGITPKEAPLIDPHHRVLLLAAQKCLQRSGMSSFPKRTGVFVGVSNLEFAPMCYPRLAPEAAMMVGTNLSSASHRVSHAFRLEGPAVTVDAACSSFTSALAMACDSVRTGRCEFALVGAANLILHDKSTEVLRRAKVLSEGNRCATFSDEADGYLRAEGFGMVLIQAGAEGALFEVDGCATGHVGGRSAGLVVPSAEAELSVMNEANKSRVDLVECHGSGTAIGDLVEHDAVCQHVRTWTCANQVVLTASKTILGHSEVASGLSSLMAVIKIMETGQLPPLNNYTKPNRHFSSPSNVKIGSSRQPKTIDRALINNFGFTGSVNSVTIKRVSNGRRFINTGQEDWNEIFWPFEGNGLVQAEKVEMVEKRSGSVTSGVRSLFQKELLTSHYYDFLMTLKEKPAQIVVPKSLIHVANVALKSVQKEFNGVAVCVYGEDREGYFESHVQTESAHRTVKTPMRYERALVIGGNGGVGKVLVSCLKAKSTVVTGRRSTDKTYHPNVIYCPADCSNQVQMRKVFQEHGPFDVVVHCAGVVRNSLLKDLEMHDLESVFRSKVDGTKLIVKLCKQYSVPRIVALSSVAAVFGSYGQVNYAMANRIMTEIIQDSGLSHLILSLGPVKDAGMLSGNRMQIIREQIKDNGFELLTVKELKDALDWLLYEDGHYLVTKKVTEPEQTIVVKMSSSNVQESATEFSWDVQEMVREVSGLEKVDGDVGLMSFGMDSLMVEDLRQRINRRCRLDLAPAEMFEYPTVNALIQLIEQKRKGRDVSEVHSTRPSTQKEDPTRIGIVGISSEIPGCESEVDFFEKLLTKSWFVKPGDLDHGFLHVRSQLDKVSHKTMSEWGVSDAEFRVLDEVVKMAVKHAHLALERSGLGRANRSHLTVASISASEPRLNDVTSIELKQGSLMELYMKNQKDFCALWVSHLLHLTGPSFAVYSACSSTFTALNQACLLLRSGQADVVVVTAVNLVEVQGHQVEAGNALASEPVCRPFSVKATGTLKGSFCGSIVLKKCTSGDNVLAFVDELAMTSDGGRQKSNFMAPSKLGQMECIKKVLKKANIDHVDYVECHGTGTLVGDAVELRALKGALQECHAQGAVPIGSLKANLGHSFAASGLAALIKSIGILRNKIIPGQANLDERDVISEVDNNLICVNIEDKNVQSINNILINNFGIGGANGCMLLSSAEADPDFPEQIVLKDVYFLGISANSVESCIQSARCLARYLEKDESVDLVKLSKTLANITSYNYRAFVIGKTRKELLEKLNKMDERSVYNGRDYDHEYALYFGHQGGQYKQMLLEEMSQSEDLRSCVDMDLQTIEDIDEPEPASIALFRLCIGIYKFLIGLGLDAPSLIIGHSFGEYPALVASSAMSEVDAMLLLRQRGQLTRLTEKVTIVAVETVEDVIDGLELIAVLAPNIKIFITKAVNHTTTLLQTLKLKYKILRGDYGFHSSTLEPIREKFGKVASGVDFSKLVIPVISSITGETMREVTSTYFVNHLRNTVRMDLALKNLKENHPTLKTVLEVGPQGMLQSLLASEYHCLSTVPSYKAWKHGDETTSLLWSTVGKLWCMGFSVDLSKLVGSTERPDLWMPFNPLRELDVTSSSLKTFVPCYKSVDPKSFRDESGAKTKISSLVVSDRDVIQQVRLNNNTSEWIVLQIMSQDPKTFVELSKVQFANPKRLKIVIASLGTNLAGHMMTALLDELADKYDIHRGYHVVLDDWSQLDEAIRSISQLKSGLDGIPKLTFPPLKQLDYEEKKIEDTTVIKSQGIVVFVGMGLVGSSVKEQLQRQWANLTIVHLGRSPIAGTKHVHLDLLSTTSIGMAARNVGRMTSYVDYCIFVAGVKPDQRPRSDEVRSRTVETKVAASRLLAAFSENNVRVRRTLLTSSLSAVTGMPFASEYAAANLWLDSVAKVEGQQMVSVQLPPVRDSLQSDDWLSERAIPADQVAIQLVRLLRSNVVGVVALSEHSPSFIRDHIRRLPPSAEAECSEDLIKRLWESVLNTKVSANDNFYSLGGNSLNALQIMWALNKNCGTSLEVDYLSEHPKFADFVSSLPDLQTRKAKKIPAMEMSSGPLTFSQEQMYFLQKRYSTQYNVVFILEFEGHFDADRIVNTLKLVIKRQKSLRTVFEMKGNQLRQTILDVDTMWSRIIVEDNSCGTLEQVIEQEKKHQFDLSFTPIRFIVKNGSVIVSQQHIITDGWSVSVLAKDFSALYSGLELPELTHNMIDLAHWLRANEEIELTKECVDWLSDKPKYGTSIWNLTNSCTSEDCSEVVAEFGPEKVQRIKQMSTDQRCTLFELMLTAFMRTLHRWNDSEEDYVTVGCPLAGRDLEEMNGVVGYFLNNTIVAVESAGLAGTFQDSLTHSKRAFGVARKFGRVPYHQVVAQASDGANEVFPYFQVFFNYRHQLDFPTIKLTDNVTCTVTHLTANNTFALACTVDEVNDNSMRVTFDFDPTKITIETIRLFERDFREMFESEHSASNVQVLAEPTVNSVDIMEMITAQDQSNIAIIKPDSTALTYGQLVEEVQLKSELLTAQFVKITGRLPSFSDVIPIVTEQCEMPVSILTVVYSGAAFCPVDSNQPEGRIKNVLSQLKARIVLSANDWWDECPSVDLNVTDRQTMINVNRPIPSTHDLAYVLFTSGSTGIPNGVQVEFGQLSSFLAKATSDFCLTTKSVVGSTTNFKFDVSLFNLFATLTNGGTLVQKDHIRDFFTSEDQFTHLFLPSAVFNNLAPSVLSSLKTDWLVVGGETPLTAQMNRFLKSGKKQRRLTQIYGPTEAVIWTCTRHYAVDGEVEDGRDIGQPNTSFAVVLDGIPSKKGSVGELWLLGNQIARGYLQESDKFKENAFGTGLRGYQTGDLVFWMTDGTFKFLRRIDDQLKVCGIRMDIREIQRKVEQHYTGPCCVHVKDDLVTLVVNSSWTWTTWRDDLKKSLPRHLIPTNVIKLTEFPLNSSGKVDKQSIELLLKAENQVDHLKSKTLSREKMKVQMIWSTALNTNLTNLNSDDTFFSVGGNSLGMIKVHSAIEDSLKTKVSLDFLFENCTLGGHARLFVEDAGVVSTLRESARASSCVYCIHAIGGTIYPYYRLVDFWPAQSNVYAIGFSDKWPCSTLDELARFYFQVIGRHQAAHGLPFVLFGHSLGGLLGWEVGNMCRSELNLRTQVVAVDSWVIGNREIDDNAMEQYVRSLFGMFPHTESMVKDSMKLLAMLKLFEVTHSTLAITLFKATKLPRHILSNHIRHISETGSITSIMDNGWSQFSTDVRIIPVDGDHDSCLDKLAQHIDVIQYIVDHAHNNYPEA